MTLIDIVAQHRDIHLAALDVIAELRRQECPEDILWTIAVADRLAGGTLDVDDEVDCGQVSRGCLLPFRSVRAEMAQILVADALDALVADGLVERREDLAA